jgi:hypothetical protein
MNAAELKLDLFRIINNLNDSELENVYNKLLVLLNAKSYRLSKDEKDAIDEALEESKKGKTYSHEEVMQEASQKYPYLRFK